MEESYKRTTTLVVDMREGGAERHLSESEKFILLKRKVEELIMNRMQLLADEASVMASDMQALVGRLMTEGHLAQIDDLRTARWYKTASQLKAYRDVYTMVCTLLGTPMRSVHLPRDGVVSTHIDDSKSEAYMEHVPSDNE
jgi:hypothetical protein